MANIVLVLVLYQERKLIRRLDWVLIPWVSGTGILKHLAV